MRTAFRAGVVVALSLTVVGLLYALASLNRDIIHRWADTMEEIESWGETMLMQMEPMLHPPMFPPCAQNAHCSTGSSPSS